MQTAQIVAIVIILLYLLLSLLLVARIRTGLELSVSMVVMVHLAVLLFIPTLGMEWAFVAWFFLGCFDSGLWLFRRELSSMANQPDKQGLAARFAIMVAAGCVLFVPTPVLQVFSGWVK